MKVITILAIIVLFVTLGFHLLYTWATKLIESEVDKTIESDKDEFSPENTISDDTVNGSVLIEKLKNIESESEL